MKDPKGKVASVLAFDFWDCSPRCAPSECISMRVLWSDTQKGTQKNKIDKYISTEQTRLLWCGSGM